MEGVGQLPQTLVMLLAVLAGGVHGKGILLLPGVLKSHMMYFSGLGSELVSRGHVVHMALPDNFPVPDFVPREGIKTVFFRSPISVHYSATKEFQTTVVTSCLGAFDKCFEFAINWSQAALEDCYYMMADQEFLDALRDLELDLVVVDGWTLMRCGYVVPQYLNLPYVSLVTVTDTWMTRVPNLPSFVPHQLMPFSDHMTFSQRVQNTMFTLTGMFFSTFPTHKNVSLIQRYLPQSPHRSWDDLARQSRLFFVNFDDVIAIPQPSMPHMIKVGGLTTTPPKELPQNIDALIKKADRDVIVVSFGSLAAFLPDTLNNKLLEAFSQLGSYTIFWRYNGDQPIPWPHVNAMKWLPQNELLAHARTKLFISHCGNNGQFEALYHGVPMVCLPLFADQSGNSARIQSKRWGLGLNTITFTPEELIESSKEILKNPEFRQNIQTASQMFHEQPLTPRQRAAFWVEHVIKYGGHHLRSRAVDMPLWHYLMLDVFLFFAVIFLVALTVILGVVLFLFVIVKRVFNKYSPVLMVKVKES